MHSPATVAYADDVPSVWVVVPAFNEASRLSGTLRALTRSYTNVVVVDDGSRDETALVAQQAPVTVLRHCVNCGQGAALQTGMDFAAAQGADAIVTFDADGQHCVEDIETVTQPILAGDADNRKRDGLEGVHQLSPSKDCVERLLAVVLPDYFQPSLNSDSTQAGWQMW